MKYLIDSSAWIEYLEGSEAGEKVHKILKENNEIFIVSIIIAEVISKVKRKGLNTELAYESIIKNSNILDLSPKICKEAGLLHAELKNKQRSLSLADALIITSTRKLNAKLITKDADFKPFSNVIII